MEGVGSIIFTFSFFVSPPSHEILLPLYCIPYPPMWTCTHEMKLKGKDLLERRRALSEVYLCPISKDFLKILFMYV